MVIDLTNSSRYYVSDDDGTSEFEYPKNEPPIYHRKVVELPKGNYS